MRKKLYTTYSGPKKLMLHSEKNILQTQAQRKKKTNSLQV